jgi:transposase
MSSIVDKWDKEDTKNQVTRSKKIRLYPTKRQKKILNEWLNLNRAIYNKTVEIIKTETKKGYEFKKKLEELQNKEKLKKSDKLEIENLKEKIKEVNKNISFQDIRNKIVTKKNNKGEFEDWWYNCMKSTREYSIRDCCSGLKGNITRLTNKTISHFGLNFKSKKEVTSTLTLDRKIMTSKEKKINKKKYKRKNKRIPKSGTKHTISFVGNRYNGNNPGYIKCKEEIDTTKLDFYCKLILYKPNMYYLIVPYSVDIIEAPKTNRICGIDPGSRTFLTCSDSDGNVHKIGEGEEDGERKRDRELLLKLKNKIDDLKSLRNRKNSSKNLLKSRAKKSVRRVNFKIRNLITELHNKVANYLVKAYDVVFVGDLNLKALVKHNKTKQDSAFNKTMGLFNHYRFKQVLQSKFELYKNKHCYFVDESNSSKSCSNCGLYNTKLGSSEVFSCPSCKVSLDRDVNASINILFDNINKQSK